MQFIFNSVTVFLLLLVSILVGIKSTLFEYAKVSNGVVLQTGLVRFRRWQGRLLPLVHFILALQSISESPGMVITKALMM